MKKRILLLADSSSSHTEKWAKGLSQQGFVVGLFSLNKSENDWYTYSSDIFLLHEPPSHANANLLVNKLKYIFVFPQLMKAIKDFRPDLLHAHYASSYGLLGALSGFKPFVLSLWGSDVFDFPRKSLLHKFLLKYNLTKADQLLATSFALKGELWKYTTKDVHVIPFGVNTHMFYPQQVKPEHEKDITYIGTIKALEDQYGIKTILEALRLIKQKLPSEKIKLFLVGGGKLRYYRTLAQSMNLGDEVVFTGKIPFKKIPYYHNLLDIFLNVSVVDESFGVAVLEAMACEKPVIVTNAPGLLEITGIKEDIALIINKHDAQHLCDLIIRLVLSTELRTRMGKEARRHVIDNYDFNKNVLQMTGVYEDLLITEKEVLNAAI